MLSEHKPPCPPTSPTLSIFSSLRSTFCRFLGILFAKFWDSLAELKLCIVWHKRPAEKSSPNDEKYIYRLTHTLGGWTPSSALTSPATRPRPRTGGPMRRERRRRMQGPECSKPILSVSPYQSKQRQRYRFFCMLKKKCSKNVDYCFRILLALIK